MKDYLTSLLSEPIRETTDEADVREQAKLELIDGFREMRHDDMTGHIEVQADDGLWYGVKGMKWGVTRSRAERAAAAKKEGATPTKAAGTKPVGKTPDGQTVAVRPFNSPGEKYAAMTAAMKAGQTSFLTNEELSWYNNRKTALSKIAEMDQSNPSWLSKTTKNVLQSAAQKAMQEVTDTGVKKYLTGPLLDNIAKQTAPTLDQQKQRAAQEALRKREIDRAVERALSSTP